MGNNLNYHLMALYNYQCFFISVSHIPFLAPPGTPQRVEGLSFPCSMREGRKGQQAPWLQAPCLVSRSRHDASCDLPPWAFLPQPPVSFTCCHGSLDGASGLSSPVSPHSPGVLKGTTVLSTLPAFCTRAERIRA